MEILEKKKMSFVGFGVIPQRYTLLTPAPSAVRKIEPTFSRMRILSNIK